MKDWLLFILFIIVGLGMLGAGLVYFHHRRRPEYGSHPNYE